MDVCEQARWVNREEIQLEGMDFEESDMAELQLNHANLFTVYKSLVLSMFDFRLTLERKTASVSVN